jgi:tetratricopeptide (TPR) repeat protein
MAANREFSGALQDVTKKSIIFRSTRVILAALFLACCGVTVQQAVTAQPAASSGPTDPKETTQTFAADFSDPQAKLVVPEAWPFGGSVEQPPAARQLPAVNGPPANLPRSHVRIVHRPAANQTVQIRPRSMSPSIAAAVPGTSGTANAVIPEPWPFEQPPRESVATPAVAIGQKTRFPGVPLWPPLAKGNEPTPEPLPTPELLQSNSIRFPQPTDVTERPTSPGEVPLPVDIVLDERTAFPNAEEGNGIEPDLRRGDQQSAFDRPTGQHTPSIALPTTPAQQPRHQGSAGIAERVRDIPARSMAVIGRHADEHVDYGFALAEKGAVHSAHAEFVEALSIIADALDAAGDETHRTALIAGLRAMDEANDFARQGKPLEAEIDFHRLMLVHKTPVLAADDSQRMTPYVAMQRYFVYAEQRLAYAGGHTSAASRALYGLGRIQPYLSKQAGPGNSLSGPKGIVFHRAALTADPRNHQAANEMGVLLARYGQLPAAADAFRHSLTVRPAPEAWHNLARVYEQQGNHTQARLARSKRESLIAVARAGNGIPTTEPAIRWVAPSVFSPAAGRPHLAGRVGNVKAAADPQSSETAPASNVSANPFQRIGRLFGRNRR